MNKIKKFVLEKFFSTDSIHLSNSTGHINLEKVRDYFSCWKSKEEKYLITFDIGDFFNSYEVEIDIDKEDKGKNKGQKYVRAINIFGRNISGGYLETLKKELKNLINQE